MPAVRRRIPRFILRLAVIFGFAGFAWLIGSAVASADQSPTPPPTATSTASGLTGLSGLLNGVVGGVDSTVGGSLGTGLTGTLNATVNTVSTTVSQVVPAATSAVTSTVTATATGVTGTLTHVTNVLTGHPAGAPATIGSSAPKAVPTARATAPVRASAPVSAPVSAQALSVDRALARLTAPAVVAVDRPGSVRPAPLVSLGPNAPCPGSLPAPTSPDPCAPSSSFSPGHSGAGLSKGLPATLPANPADARAHVLGVCTHRPAVVAGQTAGLPSTSPD